MKKHETEVRHDERVAGFQAVCTCGWSEWHYDRDAADAAIAEHIGGDSCCQPENCPHRPEFTGRAVGWGGGVMPEHTCCFCYDREEVQPPVVGQSPIADLMLQDGLSAKLAALQAYVDQLAAELHDPDSTLERRTAIRAELQQWHDALTEANQS